MNQRRTLVALLLPLLAASIALAQPAPVAAPTASQLDAYVKELQYVELKGALASQPPSVERDYFAGILANREGRLAEAVSLLEKVLPEIRSNPSRAAIALEALGDSYVKQYRYRDASRTYDELLNKYRSNIDPAMLDDDEDDAATFRLLRDAPPQSISGDGQVSLKTEREPTIGTINTVLTVNGVRESWILDSGANFSVVSRSMADRLKVKLLPGEAQTQGITGAENKLRVALLPELTLGSTTVRNVVLLVLDDQNLSLSLGRDKTFQIHAILGFPVLEALGSVTFTRDHRLLAGPGTSPSAGGAPLLMQKLMPMIVCKVAGRDLLFSYDSGATSSAFTDRYYREFPDHFKGLKKRPHGIAGAGGAKRFEAYFLPSASLDCGGKVTALKDVPTLPLLGTSTDRSYGNLGRDLTDEYESFTMDFRQMRFVLGPPKEAN